MDASLLWMFIFGLTGGLMARRRWSSVLSFCCLAVLLFAAMNFGHLAYLATSTGGDAGASGYSAQYVAGALAAAAVLSCADLAIGFGIGRLPRLIVASFRKERSS